jgi:hypothetical protein
MSANPGGGDYVAETDARGMDNQGTELDRLRAEVARLNAVIHGVADGDGFTTQIDGALIVKCDTYGQTDLHRRLNRVEALADEWEGLSRVLRRRSGDSLDTARLDDAVERIRAALEGPSDATEPASGTPGGSGASEGRRGAHSDEVERLRAEVERLRKLCLPLTDLVQELNLSKAEVARLTDYGERAIEAEAAAVRQLEAEVDHWRARALTAEADAALLSEKLAARAALRHQLDPTRGSEDGA